MLIKKGSKGEDVKKVQKYLGLTADGDFGAKTEIAVKEWQKKNGLTPDGVIGDKSWGKMFGSATTTSNKCVDSCVTYSPMSYNLSARGNRIEYIVIHYTAGGNSKSGRAIQTRNAWKNVKSSADFIVDDTTILQANPDIDANYTWACGDKKNPYSSGGTLYGKCTNRNSVSIEICSSLKSGYTPSTANHEGWYYTDAVIDNAVKLVKVLMKRYGLSKDRVVRHYDVSGKSCPGIVGYNNEFIYDAKGIRTNNRSNSDKWNNFKSRL